MSDNTAAQAAVREIQRLTFDACICGHHHVGGELCICCDCEEQTHPSTLPELDSSGKSMAGIITDLVANPEYKRGVEAGKKEEAESLTKCSELSTMSA